jgi:hypothetical protein
MVRNGTGRKVVIHNSLKINSREKRKRGREGEREEKGEGGEKGGGERREGGRGGGGGEDREEKEEERTEDREKRRVGITKRRGLKKTEKSTPREDSTDHTCACNRTRDNLF